MKKDFFVHIFSLLMIALLACGWSRSCERNRNLLSAPSAPDTCIVEKTIYIHDTIFKDKIIYKEKKVTDTLYIETHGEPIISLPVVQKHFGNTNYFDIWISGVEPLNLDSTRIYQKTEYKTETIYQDRVVYQDKESPKLELFLGGGFYSFSDVFIPKVGISTKVGQKWFISANIGFNKNTYDISVNYKIF
jgi:hypothetical protein